MLRRWLASRRVSISAPVALDLSNPAELNEGTDVRRDLLGEMLAAAGAIPADAVRDALAAQKRWGGRLGEILGAQGLVRSLPLHRCLANQQGVPFVDLLNDPPAGELIDVGDIDLYLAHRTLPWRRSAAGPIYVAADRERAAEFLRETGRPFAAIHQTGRYDIPRAVGRLFGATLTERARLDLYRRRRDMSARFLFRLPQLFVIFVLGLMMAFATMNAPFAILTGLNILLGLWFLALAGLRGIALVSALRTGSRIGGPLDEDVLLPVYSILVPLLREGAVLPKLTAALRALDYPPHLLDIKLLIESDDPETRLAAMALDLPLNFELIEIPKSHPLTKPKACNFALPFVRGEYLVVYDAEDIPEPSQLRLALEHFSRGDEKLACLQARLNFFNWRENWLTRQFALEYAMFFDLILPTLVRLGLPVPLGGTSTHFRTDILRRVGGWDPYNVTEDADLGLRLARDGYRCEVLSSTTFEEANCQLTNWLRQRSRWLKGWMQVYLVCMRHPIRLWRQIGTAGFAGFQILIGGTIISALAHPLVVGMMITLSSRPADDWLLSGTNLLLWFNLSVLLLGYGLSFLSGIAAALARRRPSLLLQVPLMPVYWALSTVAALKAINQLIREPHYWEKTVHGISRISPMPIGDPLNAPAPAD